jgi:hypothetical protein
MAREPDSSFLLVWFLKSCIVFDGMLKDVPFFSADPFFTDR